ncbi:MAG: TAXI family TRAP transporter solute-binding subunit [Deltaproteobacteria bacterium]|nr:TAXI family TRAP transporter solute-binding subunit [Deltaproteobacteria bacterium]
MMPKKITASLRNGIRKPPRVLFTIVSVFVILLINTSTNCFGTDNSGTRARISLLMATGMPGGSYHHLGLAMASLWTTKLKKVGIRVSGAISEGSRENIEAVRIEDADLILADDLSCAMAYKGSSAYKNRAAPALRSIANLWPEAVHLLIRSDKNKKSRLEDLEGLTVSTGLPESGNRFTTEMLLRGLKNQKQSIKLKFMNYVAAAEALRAGTVQASDFTSAIPLALVTNLLQQDPELVSFIEISDAELKAAREYGWLTCHRIVIPPGVYPGQDKPVNTVGQNTLLATTSSLDIEVIYDLTRTIFENVDQLAKFHPAFKNVSLENALVGLVAPLHPGAIRYYRQKKIQIPGALLPPDVD